MTDSYSTVFNTLYIGLAHLLPVDLRAFCSCAGLFYVRVLGSYADGDLYRAEVAALSRYFDADFVTYKRHVRTVIFSVEELNLLLEYDRSLAAIATCDVRDLVVEHAAQARRRMGIYVPTGATETAEALTTRGEVFVATDTLQETLEASQPLETAQKRVSQHSRANVSVFDIDHAEYEHEREHVILPLEIIRVFVFFDPAHLIRPSLIQVDRLLLQTVLRQLRSEYRTKKNKKQRRALKAKERRIERIYRACSQVPMHKLIEVTPIYGRGSKQDTVIACRVDVDVPMLQVAA
jgi:nicotinamide mononucleotide (NMN) deamidase PncC